MGAVKHLSTSDSGELRPKMRVGKLQIGNRKDNEIESQVLRTTATVGGRRLWTRDPYQWWSAFHFGCLAGLRAATMEDQKVIAMRHESEGEALFTSGA